VIEETPQPSEPKRKGGYRRSKDALFPSRLKRLRRQQGLNVFQVAEHADFSARTFTAWSSGTTSPYFEQLPRIAKALQIPVAQLFTDELVLAEVVVSADTLEAIRKGGRQVSRDTASRLSTQLEHRLWEEATRPEVDMTPGSRPRPRRSRAEVLAQLTETTKQRRQARRESQQIT